MHDEFAWIPFVLPLLLGFSSWPSGGDEVSSGEERQASDRGLQSRAAGVTDGMTLAVPGRSNLTDPY